MSPKKPQSEEHDAESPQDKSAKKLAAKPAVYAGLEDAKFCPRCGNQTAVQQPMLAPDVLQCTRCWVKYKVEIAPD
jgi:NADH pyrophosphatase NudC (nudix superfamily)